jgi:GNAT superfamily N-acetyltransferase
MQRRDYRCVGIYHQKKLIGISGLWVLCKYYVGKHLEPDNVYLLPEYRGNGIAQQLIRWIEKYAVQRGCRAVELNCYFKNKLGQRFWKKEGYTELGIHYQKILK